MKGARERAVRLREQAERSRRLGERTTDDEAARRLLDLARQLDAEATQAETGEEGSTYPPDDSSAQGPQQSPPPGTPPVPPPDPTAPPPVTEPPAPIPV